ncbi:MAG: hypothetical protein JEY96_19385 [Bacteroidales bacterium]|nr:hypothetical protein [Bacteroidales bacterium]
MRRIILIFTITLFALNSYSQTLDGTYLNPIGGDGIENNWIRFGNSSNYWSGFLWNINSSTFGNGDDFTIFTYNNRDLNLWTGNGNISLLPGTGNVGIGTTIPAAKLHVYGSNVGQGNVLSSIMIGKNNGTEIQAIQETADDDVQSIAFRVKSSSTNADASFEAMRIRYNGNVGIGTINPSGKLEILKNANLSGAINLANSGIVLRADDDGNDATLRFGVDNTNLKAVIQTQQTTTATKFDLLLNPFGGNVGIGTINPQANADITTSSSSMLLPNSSGSTNTAILRVGYSHHSWAGVQLDIGVYNHSVSQESGYPAWIQARNPVDYSINRNLLLNPNGGNVGVGTTDTRGYKLAVAGKVVAEEVVVALQADWADFVFNKDYALKDLEEVEKFIEENNHLPDVPSEKEVLENGVALGEMDAKLLQKIEELTLYMIDVNKRMNSLESENLELKKKIELLETVE